MEIKTKHNLSDKVYLMYNNKIEQMKIKGIKINIENKIYLQNTNIEINYIVSNYNFSIECSENKLFKSKEELIKRL